MGGHSNLEGHCELISRDPREGKRYSLPVEHAPVKMDATRHGDWPSVLSIHKNVVPHVALVVAALGSRTLLPCTSAGTIKVTSLDEDDFQS